MFVGEIAIPRREFLYDIEWWEARRIIRGYRKRNRLHYQLLAECAYASTFAMRDAKGKTVKDLFPALFEDDDDDFDDLMTEEEQDDLQDMMRQLNSQNQQ